MKGGTHLESYWVAVYGSYRITSVFKQAVLCIFPFIFQLYSLNEYKPPISKAKMTQITKSGIKAIKVSMQCYRMRQVIEE